MSSICNTPLQNSSAQNSQKNSAIVNKHSLNLKAPIQKQTNVNSPPSFCLSYKESIQKSNRIIVHENKENTPVQPKQSFSAHSPAQSENFQSHSNKFKSNSEEQPNRISQRTSMSSTRSSLIMEGLSYPEQFKYQLNRQSRETRNKMLLGLVLIVAVGIWACYNAYRPLNLDDEPLDNEQMKVQNNQQYEQFAQQQEDTKPQTVQDMANQIFEVITRELKEHKTLGQDYIQSIVNRYDSGYHDVLHNRLMKAITYSEFFECEWNPHQSRVLKAIYNPLKSDLLNTYQP